MRDGMEDDTADSTAECTADRAFVLVSDLLGAPRICCRVPTGSSLTRFRCGGVSGRAAASLTVVRLRVVVQRAPVLRVEVDQAARPRVALDVAAADAAAALEAMGPAASGPATSFPGYSSADIEDPKVSVPAYAVPVSRFSDTKPSRLRAARRSERAHALQQAGVWRMVYGFLKRVEQPSAKFESDRRGAIAIAERRAAASDGRCQS